MRAIPERTAAKEAGAMTYQTGIPCRYGHVGPRYVSTRQCVECQVHQKPSEHVKLSKAAKRKKKAAAVKQKLASVDVTKAKAIAEVWRRTDHAAKTAKWRSNNKDHIRAYTELYKAANEARIKATNAIWLSNNSDRVKTSRAAWCAANPGAKAAYQRTRRAKARGCEGAHTAEEIRDLLVRQRFKCAYCKTSIRKKSRADHIMPLAKSGSNLISNIQMLCDPCNARKHSKHPIEFARQIGLLI